MSEPAPEVLEFTQEDVDTVEELLKGLPEGQINVLVYNRYRHAQQLCEDQVKLQSLTMLNCQVVEVLGHRIKLRCQICMHERPDVSEAGEIIAHFEDENEIPTLPELYSLFMQHFLMAGHRVASLDELDALTEDMDSALIAVNVPPRTHAPDDISSLIEEPHDH